MFYFGNSDQRVVKYGCDLRFKQAHPSESSAKMLNK